MTNFPDVMCDIETGGLWPDRSPILQIAAVRFNLETKEIDHGFFIRSLKIPPHRFWDEATRDWWGNQPAEVYNDIVSRAEDPAVVMKDFYDWSLEKVPPLPIWWSKPSHFDFTFVASYMRDFGLKMPYDFRTANDMRSFLRGRGVEEPNLPFEGPKHNALYDCLHQIKVLFAAIHGG